MSCEKPIAVIYFILDSKMFDIFGMMKKNNQCTASNRLKIGSLVQRENNHVSLE